MSNELAVYEQNTDVMIVRPPEVVLAEAQKAAKALAEVVSKKRKPVVFNGEQYLEFEDWQTCGKFYGLTAKVVSTQFIDYGAVQGFEAKADTIRLSDGMVISSAEAMCLNDEPNWSKKPLFQLRSMAQTRACSKSLRNVLAWVVVLAGYKPTPAEEMTGNEHNNRPPVSEPQKKTEIKNPDDPATEPQLKAIHSLLNKLGYKADNEKHIKVSEILGLDDVIESFTIISKGGASKIIEALTKEGSK